jgi:DNA-binding NarL/FixJ family response regulator
MSGSTQGPRSATPLRVLAVDDHAAARAWLRDAAVQAFAGVAVEEADSLAAARQRLRTGPFDLALLDLGLPDGSGLDLLRQLRADSPDCACVITTIFDDDEHLFAALRLGASGYVLKEQPTEELATLLREMLEGRPPLSSAVARRVLAFFIAPRPPARPAPEPEENLTGRERDVLGMVAKGLSVRETADLLRISPHTAQGYVKDIYRKLAVASRAEAALAANRLGLV